MEEIMNEQPKKKKISPWGEEADNLGRSVLGDELWESLNPYQQMCEMAAIKGSLTDIFALKNR